MAKVMQVRKVRVILGLPRLGFWGDLELWSLACSTFTQRSRGSEERPACKNRAESHPNTSYFERYTPGKMNMDAT